MNPLPVIEPAITAIIERLITGHATLAGMPVLAALADDGSQLPQITHVSRAVLSIEGNFTYEINTVFGVVTDSSTEDGDRVTTEAQAHAMAADLADLVLGLPFYALLNGYGAGDDAIRPYELASRPVIMEAAEVTVPNAAAYLQACTVRFHVQF